MGGPGSGNSYFWGAKATTEECDRLDVANLARGGWLQPGMLGRTEWRQGEMARASIGWRVLGADGVATALELTYVVGNEPVQMRVPIVWTACHFGGRRPWFRCPALGCGRRVRVLYGRRYFCCRHCHELAYASTRESRGDRALRTAQRIRTQLGGTANLTEPFPPKPKGMHWRTYLGLFQQARTAEGLYLAETEQWLDAQEAWLVRRGLAPPA